MCLATQNICVSRGEGEINKVPYMYTHSLLALRIFKNINAVKWVRVHWGHDPAGILKKTLESALPFRQLMTNFGY